jgi:hypothetical protein
VWAHGAGSSRRWIHSEASWGTDGYLVTHSPRYRIFARSSDPRTSQEDLDGVEGPDRRLALRGRPDGS